MTDRIPKLDLPAVLEEAQRSSDGGGGMKTEWARVALHWVEITPVSAVESVLGGSLQSRVSHRFRLRAVPRQSAAWPCTAHRFRLGARTFDIRGAADTGDGLMTVWAREDSAS